jgi:hypothetical protein
MFDLAQQVAAKANGATKTFNTSSLEWVILLSTKVIFWITNFLLLSA